MAARRLFTLSAPAAVVFAPAATLFLLASRSCWAGPQGYPVTATYALSRHRYRLILIRCHDAGCSRRTTRWVALVENGPGYLDLVVPSDGRPRVLWQDDLPGEFGVGPLHLTTCRHPDCV